MQQRSTRRGCSHGGCDPISTFNMLPLCCQSHSCRFNHVELFEVLLITQDSHVDNMQRRSFILMTCSSVKHVSTDKHLAVFVFLSSHCTSCHHYVNYVIHIEASLHQSISPYFQPHVFFPSLPPCPAGCPLALRPPHGCPRPPGRPPGRPAGWPHSGCCCT